LILQKAFETVSPMNEELKRTEFDRAFCTKENDPSKEKQGSVTVRPRSLNPGKAKAMTICPMICSLLLRARAHARRSV